MFSFFGFYNTDTSIQESNTSVNEVNYKFGWRKGNKWINIIKKYNNSIINNNNTSTQESYKHTSNDLYKKFKAYEFFSNIHYIDLRNRCPKVYNQGNLGSCTANALAFGYEYTELMERDNIKELIDIPSRLFIYYNERKIEHTIDEDSGAELYDGISTLKDIGVCNESLWKYDINNFKQEPDDICYKDAKNHTIDRFFAIEQRICQLKAALIQGFPVIFGFIVYKSFMTEEVKKTGIMSLPLEDDEIIGGHAVAAVGFDDKNQRFIIRNSWGEKWGDNGYFYMPYQYIINKELASDFWCITHSLNINN